MLSKELTIILREMEGTSPETTRCVNPDASRAAQRKNKSPGHVGTVGTSLYERLKDTWRMRSEEGSIRATVKG